MKTSIRIQAIALILLFAPALSQACSFCRMKAAAATAATKAAVKQTQTNFGNAAYVRGASSKSPSFTNAKTFFASIGKQEVTTKTDWRNRNQEEPSEITEVKDIYGQ